MRFKETGRVVDDFYVVGIPGMPVYLLDGQAPILFDAGNVALSDLYVEQIKTILKKRSPAFLFITHSHFDHIGAAAHFKATWPDLKIAASAKTGQLLTNPKVVALMRSLSVEAARAIGQWGYSNLCDRSFEPFSLDITPTPEQELKAGDRKIRVMATPGHTWDFLSYFLPAEKILIASEAVGCQDEHGPIQAEFLVDYDSYRNSLTGLSTLDIRVLCPGHHLVLTGRDTGRFMAQSLTDCRNYVDQVEKILLEVNGDFASAVNMIQAWEWDPKPWPKQPLAAYLLNTKARVKTIWERMIKNHQVHAAAISR